MSIVLGGGVVSFFQCLWMDGEVGSILQMRAVRNEEVVSAQHQQFCEFDP